MKNAQSVNLDHLRDVTGLDKDLGKKLFKLFVETAEQSIKNIKNSLDNNKWCRELHSLKGLALNVGADHLAKLCENAMQDFSTSDSHRAKIIKSVQDEYHVVREILKTEFVD